MKPEALIQVRNLNKSFGRLPVLKDISETIREGEITGELAAADAVQEALMRRMTTTSTAPADPASPS